MKQYFEISALSCLTLVICIITAGLASNTSDVLFCSDYQRYGFHPPEVRNLFDQLLALLILKSVLKYGYWIIAASMVFPLIGFSVKFLYRSTTLDDLFATRLVPLLQRYLICLLAAAFGSVVVGVYNVCSVQQIHGGFLWGLAMECSYKIPQYSLLAICCLATLDAIWATAAWCKSTPYSGL